VRTVHYKRIGAEVREDEEDEEEILDDRFQMLFSYDTYPHIARIFFSRLDSVSLMRYYNVICVIR
jgi:hypothetical protein